MIGISTLGWVHTLSSLPAIPAAILMFARSGRIVPGSRAGRVYFISMLAGAVTVYPIAHQAVSIGIATATLVLLLTGYGVGWRSGQRKAGGYLETICLTLSAFLLALPTISETLRRLPVGHPVAPRLDSPVLVGSQASLLVLLIIGLTVQILRLRKRGRPPEPQAG